MERKTTLVEEKKDLVFSSHAKNFFFASVFLGNAIKALFATTRS
jgi:hypothetical protein